MLALEMKAVTSCMVACAPPAGGNVLFFCVAGQNRSATLAVAVQILHGKKLEEILTVCVRGSAVLFVSSPAAATM